MTAAIEFTLPPDREAVAPPEDRGFSRDQVRLLVARQKEISHRRFADLPGVLSPGDLLVVNNSATLPAALTGRRVDGRPVVVHLATRRSPCRWIVELRPHRRATGPVDDLRPGERVALPDGAVLDVEAPITPRLWIARLGLEGDDLAYLARNGRPISYAYVDGEWPLSSYQTVFATEPGSAEMPSAGRPFTADLVTRLVASGIVIAPITLHTGVSSPEAGEPPMDEWFAVPVATADLVNLTRAAGRRVIAVGTTAARALETMAGPDGRVDPDCGWTDLVLGPQRPARVVDAIITGWHAPGASHLALLEAVVGHDALMAAYDAALEARYLWHEFGDSALLVGPPPP